MAHTQLSMFEDVPEKVVKPKRVKASSVDMFAGQDLSGGRVTKLECDSPTREALVLRRPGETDAERLEREARERTDTLI